MLTLYLPAIDKGLYDEKTCKFLSFPATTIRMEHSLASISKWESKHHKTWISNRYEKTNEEMLDYIRCMCLDDVDPNFVYRLTADNIKEINKYIEDPMTAVYFPPDNDDHKSNNEAQTSELIYYCMISNDIPFECQYWHLNKLLALIRVCVTKNKAGGKGFDKKKAASDYAIMNAKRRAKNKTRG